MPTDPIWLLAAPLPLLLYGLYARRQRRGRWLIVVALTLEAVLFAAWWVATPETGAGLLPYWRELKSDWARTAQIVYALGVFLSLVGGSLYLLFTALDAAIAADRRRQRNDAP